MNITELSRQIVFNPETAAQTAITEYGTKYNQIISITGIRKPIEKITKHFPDQSVSFVLEWADCEEEAAVRGERTDPLLRRDLQRQMRSTGLGAPLFPEPLTTM